MNLTKILDILSLIQYIMPKIFGLFGRKDEKDDETKN